MMIIIIIVHVIRKRPKKTCAWIEDSIQIVNQQDGRRV